MNPQTNHQALTCKLEAYLQEETGVQGRLLALLDAQERAVREGDAEALSITGSDLESELEGEPRRERHRRELLGSIGRALGVPAAVLSMSSIAERLSATGVVDVDRLLRLRDELREALLAVRKKARRLAAVARGHQEVLDDVLRLLSGNADDPRAGGFLVDAEA